MSDYEIYMIAPRAMAMIVTDEKGQPVGTTWTELSMALAHYRRYILRKRRTKPQKAA